MNTLYVKELSKLTKVSIRTLHYYDKIGLLKPSDRLSNGYRVYSEKDLQKLEKIIALKFLGFTLGRIHKLIENEQAIPEFLEKQLALLQSEVSFLQEAQRPLLLALIEEYRKHKSINWHNVAQQIVTHYEGRPEDQNQGSLNDLTAQQESLKKFMASLPLRKKEHESL